MIGLAIASVIILAIIQRAVFFVKTLHIIRTQSTAIFISTVLEYERFARRITMDDGVVFTPVTALGTCTCLLVRITPVGAFDFRLGFWHKDSGFIDRTNLRNKLIAVTIAGLFTLAGFRARCTIARHTAAPAAIARHRTNDAVLANHAAAIFTAFGETGLIAGRILICDLFGALTGRLVKFVPAIVTDRCIFANRAELIAVGTLFGANNPLITRHTDTILAALFECIPVTCGILVANEFLAFAGRFVAAMIAGEDFVDVIEPAVVVFAALAFAFVALETAVDDFVFVPAGVCAKSVLFLGHTNLVDDRTVHRRFIINQQRLAAAFIPAGRLLRVAAVGCTQQIIAAALVARHRIIGIVPAFDGVCMRFRFSTVILSHTVTAHARAAAGAILPAGRDQIGFAEMLHLAHRAAIHIIAIGIMNLSAFTGHFDVAVAIALEPFVTFIVFGDTGHVVAHANAAIAAACILAGNPQARPRQDFRCADIPLAAIRTSAGAGRAVCIAFSYNAVFTFGLAFKLAGNRIACAVRASVFTFHNVPFTICIAAN